MRILAALPLVLALLCPFVYAAAPTESSRVELTDNWKIQPSTQVRESGEAISTAGYNAHDWYSAKVPTTVLAALVADEVYLDPYFGMNLRSIPGANYPFGTEAFMLTPMSPENPFRTSWWYRTEFTVPVDFRTKTIWLHFNGINYRANVWLNGHQIANSKDVVGTFRVFEFDVTKDALPGKMNALAVEVFPPQPDDLSITFVDWAPTPPDKNLGIWRDVNLTATGPVALRDPQVLAAIDLPTADKAHLTVTADLKNATDNPVRGTLRGKIGDVEFAQTAEIAPHETKTVSFTPDKFPQLNLANPHLWWPAQVGEPYLYTLNTAFEIEGTVSDQQSIRFGIRDIKAEVDDKDHLQFSINGKKILIRGAGYSFDMMLRSTPEKQAAELEYVRNMNLNSIRMEGKIEDDHFFDLADEYGVLVLAGWCCCDQWEQWSKWRPENYIVSAESQKDQIRRLRRHPSLLTWLNGSDFHPPEDVERTYIKILKDNNWPNPYQSSATAEPTTVTGRSGVKMTGPYLYVAPPYWLEDTKFGGAHGFNTETGPGAAIPPVESLRRMLPREHLWPIDSVWDFHAEGREFRSMELYQEVVDARYGPSKSVEEYAAKAQLSGYEAYRAMNEAFGRNKYDATGVIGWMLNSAWPSLHYHIYDYYLRQGGAYFGSKKGNEPLHVQYSYDDHSVVVVNSFYRAFKGLKVSARIYDLNTNEKFSKEATIDVAPDSSTRIFTLPTLQGLTPTYFVSLQLIDESGNVVSSNLYWMSTKPDVLDWANSVRLRTPSKQNADLTALMQMPTVQLRYSARSEVSGDKAITHVTVENPTKYLAFFVHLKVKNGLPEYDEEQKFQEQEILPVLWDDNYFALLPGEKREISATYNKKDVPENARPQVEVTGWNVTGAIQESGTR